MEVTLTGPEIRAVRELVQEAVTNLEKEIEKAAAPKAKEALKGKRDEIRHIMDKLPVEFGSLA